MVANYDDAKAPLLAEGAVGSASESFKTGGWGSYFSQVKATVQRQIVQKRRKPIACFMEVFLPVAFAGMLAFASNIADTSLRPGVNPESGNPPQYPPGQFKIQNSVVCYNGTDAHLADTLGACDFTSQYYTYICNTPDNKYYYPDMIPENFCYAKGLIYDFGVANQFSFDLQIASLDEMLAMKWGFMLNFGPPSSSLFGDDNSNVGTGYNALWSVGRLYFTPENDLTKSLVEDFNTTTALFRYAFGGYSESRDVLLPFAASKAGEGKIWAIISADNANPANPNEVSVIISMNQSAVPSTTNVRDAFALGYGQSTYAKYYASGYLAIQRQIGDYFMRISNTSFEAGFSSTDTEVLSISPMGYIAYRDNMFFTIAGHVAPFVLTLAFLYPVSQLSKRLVEEKEKRLREGTMIMGLTRGAFYSSWMLIYYVQAFATTTMCAAVLSAWVITKTSFAVTFFLYAMFGFSVVNMSALLSAFFSKSRIAALVVPLLYFMISIPSFALPTTVGQGPFVLLSFTPTMPFSVGNQVLFNYEVTNGVGAAELAANDVEPYNMALCYFFLMLNLVFCPMLMLYLDAVLPKEWGTRKTICYCCRALLCCCGGSGASNVHDDDDGVEAIGSPLKHMHDAAAAVDVYPDTYAKTSVHVRRVTKLFDTPSGEKKVAVDDVDLRLFSGMVTVLLGHNGAGKTTLMNMMTGMLDMSSGDVTVYGKSVHTSLNDVRRNVGYCPQHNILWDDLTCIEHLRYFARLKGVASDMVESEAIRLLTRVDLLEKKDVFSCNLSGGQKRKLSVAIAFIGGSQLILLDEPTAGMDVTARRHTWEIIREMCPGRTILLTTHFMDEADLLGTRVAIMSKGRLHSYGSPMFLKNNLGSGYVIRISLRNQNVTDNGAAILSEAQGIISAAELREVKGQEVAMVLPNETAPMFPQILRHFESDKVKARLNISGVSMTVSTLEDVFLRIAEEEDAHALVTQKADADGNKTAAVGVNENNASDEHAKIKAGFETLERTYGQRTEGGKNSMQQLKGLLLKRFHYARRDKRTICFQLAMPIICIFLAMILSYIGPPTPPLLWLDSDGLYGTDNKQMVDINQADGLEAVYALAGYHTAVATSYGNATAFSQGLLDTWSDNGDLQRYTAVSRRATFPQYNQPLAYTTLFNNATGLHSTPQGLQAYYQSVVRKNLNFTTQAAMDANPNAVPTLNFASWPLPFTNRQNDQIDAIKHFMVALFVLIPFTFIPSTYVAYTVKERECKSKHLQFVSGVSYLMYWFSNFLFDLLSYTITAACAMIIFVIFKRDEYIGDASTTGVTILIFMLYGVSGIFAAYALSFLFDSHSTAQNIVMISNFVIGFCLVMANYILSQMDSTKDGMKAVAYIFRIVPAFCLGEGIMNVAITQTTNTITGSTTSLYDADVAGANLAYMAGASVLFMIITLVVDHPKRKEKQRMVGFDASKMAPMPAEEDEDVAEERDIVTNGKRTGDVIVVKGLRKVYPIGLLQEKVAVQNITFGVKQGEVFGFLGTNGAGKTTTMSVLTGEFVPTMGEAQVCGFDVVRQAKEAFRVIGYCPQFDALLDLLTPAEHLNLYAALRGIAPADVAAIVDALIVTCGLDEFRAIPSMRLSGGNKRKLSVAVALMGNPQLVFLDEPSAGMDPHARRMLWDVIVFIAKHSSVLLTTHHLEEVDVLAHRVGIMDAGLMKCLGTLEHLKTKFGSGFELTIRVTDHAKEAVAKDYIMQKFPLATLVETREQRLVFALPAQATSLADLFEEVQRAQKDAALGIADYIVQQTSLENVFMKITAEAAAEEEALAKAAEEEENLKKQQQNSKNKRTDAYNSIETNGSGDLQEVSGAPAVPIRGGGYSAILGGGGAGGSRNNRQNTDTTFTPRE